MPTITPNLGLTLPDLHEEGWGPPILNVDFTLIDTFAGMTVEENPTESQTVTQPLGTALNVNYLQAYGTVPIIRFGVLVNVWDTAISRPAAGSISLDTNVAGNGAATVFGGVFSAGTGFQINNTAPLNHFLVGNGTEYVDAATLPVGLLNYQTVQQAGIAQTQRAALNFLAPFTAVDDAGNSSTDIGLATSGVTAGTYSKPTLTVNAKGLVTAATPGSAVSASMGIVTGSRSLGTVYQNTGVGPMIVTVTSANTSAGTETGYVGSTSGGLQAVCYATTTPAMSEPGNACMTFVVPAGYYYKATADTLSLVLWTEWALS